MIKEFRFCELVHLIEANYKWFHDEEFDTLSIKIQTSFTSTCCGGSLEIRDHMARNSTETYIQLALIKALVWSWRRKWQCCEKWICFQFFIWEKKKQFRAKKKYFWYLFIAPNVIDLIPIKFTKLVPKCVQYHYMQILCTHSTRTVSRLAALLSC